MRKVLNIMLIISLILAIGTGIFVFIQYQDAKKADVALLQQNTEKYEDPLKIKKGHVDTDLLNVIYYMDQESSTLKEVVLEFLNCTSGRLSFLVLPKDTRISLEPTYYQKLCAINAKMPQYFNLSILPDMFSKKEWAGYGQLLIDEELGIDSNCYSVVYGTASTFEEYCKSLNVQLMQEESIQNTMSQAYETAESNLSLKKMSQYVASYAKLTAGDIKYFKAAGDQLTEEFRLNDDEISEQIENLINGQQSMITE